MTLTKGAGTAGRVAVTADKEDEEESTLSREVSSSVKPAP